MSAPTVDASAGEAFSVDASSRARPGGRVARRVALSLAGVVVLAILCWWARGPLAGAAHTVVTASWEWLLLAAVAKGVSMVGLAQGQRRLVAHGSAQRPTFRSILATAYAGNAISIALPLAGAGLSAAFTFRRYVAGGAPSAQAATGLAVSWAVATSALTAVLSTAAAATGQTGLLVTGTLGGLASVAAVAALLLGLQSGRGRSWSAAIATPVVRIAQRFLSRPAGEPGRLVRRALEQLAATRLRRRDIAAAAGSGLVLWIADIVCLGCAVLAVGGRVPLPLLVLAWSAGVAATSFSFTPGGLGLVETALTAALVTAGLSATPALAGVLLYRLIGFWLVGAIGAVVLAFARRTG